MKLIADLQIHSRFSIATSKNINLENLEKFARLKGVNLLGTGDISHPEWLKELKTNLIEDGTGILTSKSGFKFVLQGEISNIYTKVIGKEATRTGGQPLIDTAPIEATLQQLEIDLRLGTQGIRKVSPSTEKAGSDAEA